MSTQEQELRWSRVVKIRELINTVTGELNADVGTMTRDSELSMMWLAAEVAGGASDAVSVEHRVELRQLYDEMYADFEVAGVLMPAFSKGERE